jgi:AcrR family transcriptional regulator
MNDSQTKAGRPRNPALDAILSAAARQLGEFGHVRMSLESVAAAAGTTVPTLRRRYRNKAELAAAVIGSSRDGRCSGKRWRPAASRTPLTSMRSPACLSAPSTAGTSPSSASPTTGQIAC